MTPNKDNFYFRHTKGDAVSERAVKMLDHRYAGSEPYYGKRNGHDFMDDKPFLHISYEVSPTEAIRLMEGGEVWEPKWGELVEVSEDKNCWAGCFKFLCTNSFGINIIENDLGVPKTAKYIRPIQPAPPTAEQELKQIVWGYSEQTIKDVMEWHTKHQPKEVEVTDHEIITKWQDSNVIETVRWALARAKGGEK